MKYQEGDEVIINRVDSVELEDVIGLGFPAHHIDEALGNNDKLPDQVYARIIEIDDDPQDPLKYYVQMLNPPPHDPGYDVWVTEFNITPTKQNQLRLDVHV